MKEIYVPDRGDWVWMDFHPQAGHEQAGRRPALVLSPVAYNRLTGLALVCPVTRRAKGYAFEVPVSGIDGIRGVVLADQVKCVDWRVRRVEFAGRAPGDIIVETQAKLAPLLGF